MSKAGSAAKVKLSSYDDLFGNAEEKTGSEEQIIRAKLTDLHEFRNHPFRVLDDEKMEETTESISKYGVLVPGIARPRAEGGYEIIAGHRRKRGSERAGKEDMPVIVAIIQTMKLRLSWWIPTFSVRTFCQVRRRKLMP